ncbi:MAG: endonuclease MutS2, partial [Bdellovibrionales bacterium]|nr:endonuclease MutS2 [Bdellovibrionales bacterium]
MSELEKIDWPQILDRLEKLATSEMGRSQLRKTEALDKPSSALDSLQIISEFQAVIELGQRPFMESLDLYSTWFTRLEKRANLKTLELKDIRHFCIEALALHEILGNLSSPWIVHYQKQILPAEEPLSAIDNLMTPDGQIRNDASKELFRLYKEKESLGRDIQLLLDQLVTQHELEGILQDRYVTTREGRWVLPIKSGMQSRFAGIIHASSQSKQTVFMEPKEVVLQNNRLRELEVAIEEEIERLLKDLTEYLSSIADEIKQTKEVMKECDIRFAQAHLANQMQASSPLFTENEIELIEVRHPVFVLKHEQVVANNVKLNIRERILLLSGPNAGGKTVLLKAIGLAAQMARCGLPICAQPGSKLPFFSPLTVA